PPFRFFPAKRSIARGVSAALRVMRESLPLQSLLAAPFEWSEAIERAKSEAGPFDATIVLLSRLHPWISVGGAGVVRASGAPPAQRRAGGAHHSTTILDAIDSLTRNASERASQASPLARWFWRIEERRVARAEADAAKHYERVLFVSDEDGFDREQDGFAVVSNGVAIHPLEEKPRRYDFGFWGRLAYFANSDAAEYLLDEIWPRIRERRASATLAIGGAHATKSIRRKANQAGVTLTSPVDHMHSAHRRGRSTAQRAAAVHEVTAPVDQLSARHPRLRSRHGDAHRRAEPQRFLSPAPHAARPPAPRRRDGHARRAPHHRRDV